MKKLANYKNNIEELKKSQQEKKISSRGKKLNNKQYLNTDNDDQGLENKSKLMNSDVLCFNSKTKGNKFCNLKTINRNKNIEAHIQRLKEAHS